MFGLMMKWMKAKKILPQISDTERQALEAGNVWIDGGFFAGKLDLSKMLAESYGKLSPEEQAFVDGPTSELCAMIDRYEIGRTKRIPDAIVDFIKKQGFMSLLIPKKYGGKEFSTLAISTVMHKIAPYSTSVSTWVVIPNSLGAAELIKHYGTEAQKDHYLPKLASGEYVPCFGLTEPTAGSDAASIKAEGLVFKDTDGEVKIKLNFRKRYITLAPVANLASIACRLKDPQNLLGKGEDAGITVVMVHKGTPGFSNGDHHDPIGESFENGPLIGKDVVVSVDQIIGGPKYAGLGWKMLMEQLAGGRAVSLPASAVGGIKAAAAVTGAYSMVRQQFGIPIGRMEGVEERVGRIAAMTYMTEAARVFACSAIDRGIQPPVVSAVLKAYTTEAARQMVIDAMDVFSGAGVMQGPNNILGKGYASAPVAITVEGANIMTRTLMIFGQGATRCHPYALNVVAGVETGNVALFRSNLLGWIGHFFAGIGRSFIHGITRGFLIGVPDVAPETRKYYRRLGWSAARFGLLTDLAMFFIGGKLKARGKLTGRYADALAWMVLGFSALRRFEAEGRRREDLPLVEYALKYAMAQVQQAFEGIFDNFEGLPGALMRTLGAAWVRINRVGALPTDRDSHLAALTIQTLNDQYRRLTEGVFVPAEHVPGAGRLMKAFRLVTEAHAAAERIIQAQKAKKLPRGKLPAEIADEAMNIGLISMPEAKLLKDALAARMEAIEVDVFKPEQVLRDGQRRRRPGPGRDEEGRQRLIGPEPGVLICRERRAPGMAHVEPTGTYLRRLPADLSAGLMRTLPLAGFSAGVQNRPMNLSRWPAVALACIALVSGCAQKSRDTPAAVAERFYEFYLSQKMNRGLPSIEQCRQMTPLLSRGLQDAIGKARREQDKFITEHPGEKPPWVDGDLFTSLFEGATAYEIGRIDHNDSHADVLVALKYSSAKDRDVSWTDRLVLVRENDHWVVEDLEYGGNWDFANHGTLRQSLTPIETPPEADAPVNSTDVSSPPARSEKKK